MLKSLIEFLGTYIALTSIFYVANKYPNYVALVVGLSFGLAVYILGDISGNFNPAITLMFVLAKKQPVSDLFSLIIPQLLGAVAALNTYKFIEKMR